MRTVEEIETAIRQLGPAEKQRLQGDWPKLFGEAEPAEPVDGDKEWERIINDPRPRPKLKALTDQLDEEYRKNPAAFPDLTDEEFERHLRR